MKEVIEFILYSVLIGIGATALVDFWGTGLKRIFGIPSMNWRLVGRWFGHMPAGRFVHERIADAAPIRGELAIGWIAHYAIGIVFAGVLLAIWSQGWVRQPTLVPALIVGLATVAAPFFIMQPGLGLGIAAAKTPNPMVARLRSLLTHTVFGLGLYLTARALAALIA